MGKVLAMTNRKLAAPTKLEARSIKELQRALARSCMGAFVKYTMPGYLMGWVHETICRELDSFLAAVIAKQSPRLMLELPPRHGKSELATRRFPASVFGRFPDMSILNASYSGDLSSRMNIDVQRIMDSEKYADLFPGVVAGGKGRQRNSELFEIAGHSGSYRSAGVGGGITGMGGDILIVDDPIKDRAEADSQTIRDKVYDWYTSTFYTRLAPGGGILLIQTRWHMDDLAGRLLEKTRTGEGDNWRRISFPAIAEEDELHRKRGEALHPERYPLEQLLQIKTAIGTRDWEALYQQHPVPDGGAIFRSDWFKHYHVLPEKFQQIALSWDMAFKDSDTSDYVVGQAWGRIGADYYLIDQVRGRWSFTETLARFVAFAEKFPPNASKYVEDKANGTAVIDTLKKHVSGIIPVTPTESKTARAYAVTPLFEAGNVYFPAPELGHRWESDYEAELLQFPSGAHDDQVDATTQALNELSKRRRTVVITDEILADNARMAAKRGGFFGKK